MVFGHMIKVVPFVHEIIFSTKMVYSGRIGRLSVHIKLQVESRVNDRPSFKKV